MVWLGILGVSLVLARIALEAFGQKYPYRLVR